MSPTTTETRRLFAGFASYESFLNNDPFYYASTKWHQRLRKKRLKCRPFRLQEWDRFLFVVHDTQNELLLTRVSVEFAPCHEEHPDDPFFEHLYQHNILAYDRAQLEQAMLNSEVEERLCALITFEAGQDLLVAISALDMRVCAPASWTKGNHLLWSLGEEAAQ